MIGLYVMIYNRLLRAWAEILGMALSGEEESYACESFRYSPHRQRQETWTSGALNIYSRDIIVLT